MAKANGAAGGSKSKSKNVADRAARKIDSAITKVTGNDTGVPGPSPNPATNLIIHDVLLRAGGRLMRTALEKGLLANRYGSTKARKMIDNRSMVQTLASYAVARLATRSLPGAVVIGGGLVAKTLFDRGRSRRANKRAGDATLNKMAED